MSLKLSNDIKAEAKRLGFFACGIAKAAPVEPDTAAEVVRWLDNECFAEMAYMNNYTDKRLNPQLLMPSLKSIVCVAMSYAPAQRMPEGQYQLASYAYGQDYHEVVKGKLRQRVAVWSHTSKKVFRTPLLLPIVPQGIEHSATVHPSWNAIGQ